MIKNETIGVSLLLASVASSFLFVDTANCSGGDISFQKVGGELLMESPRWAMALDANTGAIRGIEDRSAEGTLLRGGADLWTIERHEEPEIKATACKLKYQWNEDDQRLTLDFDGPEAAVRIVCPVGEDGPAWQAEIHMKRGTLVGWKFPNALEFNADRLNEFVLPEHLGLAFTRSWFQPGGAGIEKHPLGSKGLRQVTDDRCQMRPVQDEPVAAKPGKDASEWLWDWYLKEMPRWQVTANRCPADGKHDLSLIETEHGCWLSGYQLGGRGWLFRFGGMLRDNDSRPQIASVIATLARLYRKPVKAPAAVSARNAASDSSASGAQSASSRIGIVLATRTARPGVRLQPDPGRLATELARQSWVTDAGIEVIALRDARALRQALAKPDEWFAIVNLIGEGFPAESAKQIDSMLQAIRDYVRSGGVWWEAGGGYSFYQAILPGQDATFQTANRDFCDFAAVDSKAGHWTLFGIQQPDNIYTPARAEITSSGAETSRVGRYTHTFLAFAKTGETIRVPRQQMVLGESHRNVLREYSLQNGFTRGLAEKAAPKIIEKLKRCILLKVSTRNLKKSASIAEGLPFPVLFHSADYLKGGFDKQYPDHLPPNPSVGTPEDLSRLIRACQRNGHLFMPYTNPTWWCINPKGPTFEKHGDAALSRDLDGNIYSERYGGATTQGHTICAWHPDVVAANDATREQFTKQYPVDVLFQDQVGARSLRWDTNPASPNPGAYLEGIHRIARRDSAFVPLGTEDGQDRLINWETMFCGLSWPWLPNRPSRSRVLYEDLWPEGSWRIEPLALFLAHDKVLFYHHDLGGFVRNRLDLTTTLAMGYGLSWWTHSVERSPQESDWIERLCRVQAAVGSRCAGRPLDDFEYVAPQVIRSQWGNLEIIANLTAKPWPIDAQTVVAPEGFLARSPDLEAGIFTRHAGGNMSSGGLWLIREKEAEKWSEWSAQPEHN